MDPELLNYPEPAYRRHAKSVVNTETDFEPNSEPECCTDCDMDQQDKSNSNGELTRITDDKLIDVEVANQEQLASTEQDLVNSSYLELLSSLDPPASTLDLLTSDIPDLMSQDNTPAQLILEPTENGESGSVLEPNGRATDHSHNHGNMQDQKMKCEARNFYDDSHPFLV